MAGGALTRRAWLAAVAASVACSRAPSDPVEALLAELEDAAEARDTERFGERLSERFRGERGLRRADAMAELRRTFAAYESVGLEVYGLEVDREDGSARVRCVVEFSGRARTLGGLQGLLPPSAVYRFTLELEDEAEAWRVRAAAWESVAPEEDPRLQR